MIPCQSDIATELFHWQRYLFFRPWYEEAIVIDAACGEGYGSNYASVYAKKVIGYDIAPEAVLHATHRYQKPKFKVSDVCEADYSTADTVISFETIEHLPDPEAFLQALKACQGKIVISTPNRNTHSPGNKLSDKPFNQYHTIEWTPSEFAELIQHVFPDRQVRFLSQEGRWPGLIREGLEEDAMYTIAVIGDGELPTWPRLGISIPTCNNFQQLQDTILSTSRHYPGEIEFAVVANGTEGEDLAKMREVAANMPYMVHLIELPTNTGYGMGANKGLDFLWQEGWFDYYCVMNDDVIPVPGCMIEMVECMRELDRQGMKPGVVGPVSNSVNGQQQVDIGAFTNMAELMHAAESRLHSHHSSAYQFPQVRGLCMLIHPDCLSDVGGFDPRFGRGNFEDDDHNLRTRLAGYTLWIAEGAFLFHHGSQTFRKLNMDYTASIERNMQSFQWKWDLAQADQWALLDEAPEGVKLFVPLSTPRIPEFAVVVEGETVDLIHEASDIEFVAWVHQRLQARHRNVRRDVVAAIMAPVEDAQEDAA